MKQSYLISISIIALALAGCNSAPEASTPKKESEPATAASAPANAKDGHAHSEGDGHDHGATKEGSAHEHSHDHGSSTKYGLEVINASKGFRAGNPFDLRLAVRNNESGAIQKSFDTVHEKKLHLIVMSEGLTGFQHLHPEMDADGFWIQRLTLPHGGRFLVFADGGAAGEKFSAGTELIAEGDPAPQASFALSNTSEVQGVTAQIVEGTKLPLSDHAHVTVKLSSLDGWESYLGEPGHLILVRQDGQEFLHAHPKGPMKNGQVVFDAHFHEKGVYRAWAQFRRNSKVLTFPFTVEVGDAE